MGFLVLVHKGDVENTMEKPEYGLAVEEKMYREKRQSKEAGLPQLEVDLGKG